MCVLSRTNLRLYIQTSVATGGLEDRRKEWKIEENVRENDLRVRELLRPKENASESVMLLGQCTSYNVISEEWCGKGK